MTTLFPKVLALAYYDGATEGFLNEEGKHGLHFFKVVAWDQNQNRRLYLLGKVDRIIYLQLLEILERMTHQVPTGQVWVPAWTFDDPDLEAHANSLVETGRRSLDTPDVVALGQNVLDELEVMRPNARGLASAIALARQSEPGDLTEWMTQSI